MLFTGNGTACLQVHSPLWALLFTSGPGTGSAGDGRKEGACRGRDGQVHGGRVEGQECRKTMSVSYTHLTLPTKLSV